MLNSLFTYNDLQEEMQWNSRPHSIEKQIVYAAQRGIFIKPVGTNRPQLFEKIEFDGYNIKQLKDKFNWDEYVLKSGIERQMIYAESRGIKLEIIEPPLKTTTTYFKIIEIAPGLEEEWVGCAGYPSLEINRFGYLRRADNKRLVGSKNYAGYMKVNDPNDSNRTLFIHRLMLMTFKPIECPEKYVVDHVNGIRDDNRLENLRWVLRRENNEFKDENWANIGAKVQQLIEKIGYEKTEKIIQKALDNLTEM